MEVAKLVQVSGFVVDTKTGKPVPEANIYLKSDRTNNAYSDKEGFFALKVPMNQSDILVVTCPGFHAYRHKVTIAGHRKIKVDLLRKRGDKSFDDHILVKLAISGDQKAYAKLMERYRDSIYFMIQKMVNNKEDADDLTMEAFGKAFSKIESYSPDFAFSTWLFRIAINNCIDFIRKKRLNTLSIDEPIDGEDGTAHTSNIPSHNLDPEEHYIKQQRAKLIREVIVKIRPKYRRLIELRFFQEMSYDEIAREMNLPLGTIKAQLYRAKELLFNILKTGKENY